VGAHPDEKAMQKEEEEELARFREAGRVLLDGDTEARAVFECLCDGVTKRAAIAARLGLDVLAVKNARKRMERILRTDAGNGGKALASRSWGRSDHEEDGLK
jgi:hypothetical protein